MEKISSIVRGNARVTSADVKSSSAVRPGVPSFGRAVGESPLSPEKVDRDTTTASRASVLHSQLAEGRRSSNDRIVADMADQFFLSRVRRPAEPKSSTPEELPVELQNDGQAHAMASLESEQVAPPPSAYKPRGSYVDVRA